MPERVFVYGTLMRGHYNHFHMEKEGVKFLGNGRAKGFTLYDVTPYYPGAIKENNGVVLGEVYEVPDEIMGNLDALEGNGSLYQREKVPVTMENGEVLECWIYLWINGHWVYPEFRVPLERQPWQKSRMKFCHECDGEGGWDCETCDGKDGDCPECHGEGWVSCPDCGGKGFIVHDDQEVTSSSGKPTSTCGKCF